MVANGPNILLDTKFKVVGEKKNTTYLHTYLLHYCKTEVKIYFSCVISHF